MKKLFSLCATFVNELLWAGGMLLANTFIILSRVFEHATELATSLNSRRETREPAMKLRGNEY